MFRLWILGACLGALVPAVAASPALALSNTPDPTWVTQDTGEGVSAVAQLGGTTYIGGHFTRVGPRTGPGVAIDAASGRWDPAMPQMSGDRRIVEAVAPDGAGGWYVGGGFTHVDGLPRANIAHILPNKTVDPSFAPNANGEVLTLAVAGSTVYVGGKFTSIGGQTRNRIAALGASNGRATGWNPSANGLVDALRLSGSTVYAGGAFTRIGGQSRNDIAALRTSNGQAMTWNPNADGQVHSLTVSGSIVYAGGEFNHIGGQPRRAIAALNAATGQATGWNPDANNDAAVVDPPPKTEVDTIVVAGSTVYVGGWFTSIGLQPRNYLAAVDAATGLATAWNPDPDHEVVSLALSGSTIYAGGFFRHVGVQQEERDYLAAIDTTTALPTSWTANASDLVFAVGLSGSTLYAGGELDSIDMQPRAGLAAIDSHGRLTGWNPNPDSPPDTLTASGSTIYVAGPFTEIGGQQRTELAALDPSTGQATAWNANATCTPFCEKFYAMTVSGSTLYVGGVFDSSFGGQTRVNAVGLDASTGAATPWSPNPNGQVLALAASPSAVYAGGVFTSAGGQARSNIAALDPSTGAATAWNPGAGSGGNPYVDALAVSGPAVYAGGSFTTVAGQPRANVAAIDAASGQATAWNPSPNDQVFALATSGSTVYAGGIFTTIAGQPRRNLAALDASTGAALAFDPSPNLAVQALSTAPDGTLAATGYFTTMELAPQQGVARFSP